MVTQTHLRVLIVIFFFLTKKDGDLQCLLTKNMIKACKTVIFSTVRSLMKIEPLDPHYGITGYSVGLAPTLIWAIREARLHNSANPSMIFNLKLDGRHFAGNVKCYTCIL